MKKYFRFFVLSVFFICFRTIGNAQSFDSADTLSNVDSATIIKNSVFPTINYQWVSYQMKIDMDMQEEKMQFQCFFVNRIDSLIYLNLNKSGIELARLVLTPESVVYVNKMEHKYYTGDYSFFKNMLGFPLDYPMIQSMFNAVDFPNFEDNFKISNDEGKLHFISPLRRHTQNDLTIMQEIQIGNDGIIEENDITEMKTLRDLTLEYQNYILVDNFRFFSKLSIEMESDEVLLNAEIKNIKFNQAGPTNIKIPDTFEPLQFEK